MNPFELQENRYQHGDKKKFYFSQFDEIDVGFENAKKAELLSGGTFKECRMYLDLYLKSKGRVNKAKTKVVNNELWIAIVGVSDDC